MSRKQEALAVRQSVDQALTVAEGADRNDRRGKDNITSNDVILPRLAVAQKTSPQIDPSKTEYIDGLKLFEMFNSVTGMIYGNGPLQFAVIRRLPVKAMEFDADNNIVDFDVPPGDPRREFTTDDSGNRVKPQATEFHEYLAVLVPSLDIVVLSFKTTQVKVAKKLNSFLQFRPGAAWMGLYSISSASKSFGAYTAAQFTVLPAGPTPKEVVEFAQGVFEATEGVKIDTNRDAATDADEGAVKEDAPF